MVDRGQRPCLGEPLGKLAKARSETRVFDPLGGREVAGIGRGGEQVEELRRPPGLASDDGQCEARRSEEGADERDQDGRVYQG